MHKLLIPTLVLVFLSSHILIGQSHQNVAREWISVSRNIHFDQENSPGAFFLNRAISQTVEFEQVFVGDVDRGGSCNVDYLTFCPHNITHIETSAHILSGECQPPTVADINPNHLTGTAFLIDLSDLDTVHNGQITVENIHPILDTLSHPIQVIGIKTPSSNLNEHFDFSGKGFLSLHPETAKYLHKFQKNGREIKCLILDLPSIDQEVDEGKLLAHRAWFGLPETGIVAHDTIKNTLIELAYFHGLAAGYYDVHISPPKFQSDAAPVGIHLRKQ